MTHDFPSRALIGVLVDAEELGLTRQAIQVIAYALTLPQPLSVYALAKEMGKARPSISVVATDLENRGYLVRHPVPGTRRRVWDFSPLLERGLATYQTCVANTYPTLN